MRNRTSETHFYVDKYIMLCYNAGVKMHCDVLRRIFSTIKSIAHISVLVK